MFYDVMKAVNDCNNNPKLLFDAIKYNYREVYEKVLENDSFDFNITNDDNENVLMCLLKNKDYDLVNKYIIKDNININYQNNDGDTIMHILVTINYVEVREILEKVLKRNDFLPNIKNNNNQTILDKSLNKHYLYTSMKILEDRRFNNINLYSFKNLYETYIKSNNYGTYSKLNNYAVIFNNLKKKKLKPTMSKLIKMLKKEKNIIKNDFYNSKTKNIDMIINHLIEETI